MAANPFLDPNAVAAQGQQADALPPPTPVAAANPFDSAIDTVLEQMRTDSVNSPVKPIPAINPFNDPLVSLGFALQGQASQAVQMGAQVNLQNSRRLDAYNNQLLQAENYRSLRKQRLTTTLAGLQAQAGRVEIDEEHRRRTAEIATARFERTEDRLDAAASELADYRQATLDAQTAERDRDKSLGEFLNAKGNEDFRAAYLRDSERLETFKAHGTILGQDGRPVFDLAQGTMTAKQKADALDLFRGDMEVMGGMLARMGRPEEAAAWMGELDAIVKDEKTTIDETSILTGPSAGGIFDPDTKPTGPVAIDAAKAQLVARQETLSAPQVDPTGDVNEIAGAVQYLDQSLRTRVDALRSGESRDPGFTKDEQIQADIQVSSGRINEGIENDRFYLGGSDGTADLKRLAAAVTLEVLANTDTAGTKEEFVEAVKFKLTQEHGIPVGFIDSVIKGRIRTVIKQEFSRKPTHKGRGQRMLIEAFTGREVSAFSEPLPDPERLRR